MQIHPRKYDLIIVGGGIAGLATAEMFARSGHKVLLLEKRRQLCQETSGLHHEWFHFGSLYAIFPQKQYLRTMTGGIDDLLQLYRDFDGMNLRIDGAGKLVKIETETPWFRQDNLEYVIATTAAPDFDLSRSQNGRDFLQRAGLRLAWNLAIKRFVGRHSRFHKYDWRRGFASHYIPQAGWRDYSNDFIHPFDNTDVALEPACHLSMASYDCPMHADHIVADLTRGLLSRGGEIRTQATYCGMLKTARGIEVATDRQTFFTDRLIFASGQALQSQSNRKVKIKSVVSPLLVVTPRVCERNLVRLTPFVSETINHIHHTIDGQDYSLIGGGYFAPVDDEAAIQKAGEQLLQRAKQVFPALENADFMNLYFGTKSEMISEGAKRNYLYRVEKLEDNVYCVVPGKFSLAFSLAYTAFNEITGNFPVTYTNYDRNLDVSEFVGLTRHKTLVKNTSTLKLEVDSIREPELQSTEL